MDNLTLDIFLKNTYTQTDALRRLRILNTYLQQVMFIGNQKILEDLSPADSVWIKSLPPEFFKQFQQQTLDGQITGLKDALIKLKTLTIYTPIALPEDEQSNFGEKLRAEYGKYFLLEFKLNPLLIGGAALIWNGKYRDYSLKSRIDHQKERILSILKEYVH